MRLPPQGVARETRLPRSSSPFLIHFYRESAMRVALLLYCLPAAALAMCFIQQPNQGRREVIRNATTVIDEYQCKIECALMDTCLAYFYQAKGTQCVLLGPHEIEPRCAAPANESLKYINDADCKDINSTDVVHFNFEPNPIIPRVTPPITGSPTNEKARPCNKPYAVMDLHLHDGTHHTATCDPYTITTWDKKLATWKYTYQGWSGPLIVNDTSICNDGKLPPYPGMSAAQMPSFGSLRPCTESPGQEINCVLKEDGTMANRNSKNDFVYCIYGSWFLLNYVVDMNSSQEIIAASCTNSTA